LIVKEQLFLSASYGIGARLVNFKGDTVWDSNDLMSSQYTTCIEHQGLLYGVDGRQDIPPANLKCFDPVTQKVLWTKDGFGYATLIKADGKLLIVKTDGELVLAALNSSKYQELARTRLFNDTVRALPALANGRLYVRDGRTLKCVDLTE
jgi:outer membrane protein assembly factor BamB